MTQRTPTSKIVSLEKALVEVAALRRDGAIVVFTNGCFDLLHAGHVRYLQAARNSGDLLVVGLNSDVSVNRLKGRQRPLNPQQLRAEVLAALTCVDLVTVFDDPDPLALIHALEPDVLVKGADWPEKDIVGADEVKARGGRVVRVPLVADISTSALIQRVLDHYRETGEERP